jgi:hypothetical protein
VPRPVRRWSPSRWPAAAAGRPPRPARAGCAPQLGGAQHERVGFGIGSLLPRQGGAAPAAAELQLQCLHDSARDFVLHGEHAADIAVVALAPDVVAGPGVNELRRDPQEVAVPPHAALEHVRHAQRTRDRVDRHLRAAVRERAGAGCHAQFWKLRQHVEQFLREPVRKELLIPRGAHVRERQHRNGSLFRGPRGTRPATRALRARGSRTTPLRPPSRGFPSASAPRCRWRAARRARRGTRRRPAPPGSRSPAAPWRRASPAWARQMAARGDPAPGARARSPPGRRRPSARACARGGETGRTACEYAPGGSWTCTGPSTKMRWRIRCGNGSDAPASIAKQTPQAARN